MIKNSNGKFFQNLEKKILVTFINRKQAFREAFELFDKNGGGTIDASELQRTLADVDIHIDSAGLLEVFKRLQTTSKQQFFSKFFV